MPLKHNHVIDMKIGIIGGGNMGGAIARGLAHSNSFASSDITVCDPGQPALDALKTDCQGIATSHNNIDAVTGTDVIIIAVKPWLVEGVLMEIAPRVEFHRQIIVSIAAGVTIDAISSWLKGNSADGVIFRAMPNTAIAIHQSMTFLAHRGATPGHVETVTGIFNLLGKTAVIEERLMGAATALCSCGIAYAMRYVRAATEGGVELGIYPNQGKEYVLQTLRGAIELLEATGNNPEVEIDKVTTPGGVTIKGLNAMESHGFTASVIEGLKASR